MTKNKISNFKLGTDPELFIYSEKLCKFIPVCGMIGGTKEHPIQIDKNEPMFSLQEDNVAVEFTIPPVNTLSGWLNNINYMKNFINETILKPKDLLPIYSSSARFEIEDLNDPRAQHMGCNSSYNAWTYEQHQVDRSDYTLRTTGNHIHVGYDNHNPDTSIELIKAMDLFLGVPSVLIDPDTERRKMYGKCGDYRIKTSYGVEYRSLGGYFLTNNELLTWVYNNTLAAIDFVNTGGMEIITNAEDIQKCINTCDKDLANEIIEDYKIEVLNYENN